MSKRGFTLAEILITLGIIGIVAAMTMPSLLANINKKKTVTKLTKALSVVNQAYKNSLNDLSEPTPAEARTMGARNYYNTYWAPYIKSSHYCLSYKDCGYQSSLPWVYMHGGQSPWILMANINEGISFYTTEGIMYMVRVQSGIADDNTLTNWIIIDTNGGLLPNKVGKDVFFFTRDSEDGTVKPACYTYSDSTVNSECSNSGEGRCCAEKVRRAGWKMDKTYPW